MKVNFQWADTQYSDFMTHYLRALEPRLYEAGEYIFEEGEEVDE